MKHGLLAIGGAPAPAPGQHVHQVQDRRCQVRPPRPLRSAPNYALRQVICARSCSSSTTPLSSSGSTVLLPRKHTIESQQSEKHQQGDTAAMPNTMHELVTDDSRQAAPPKSEGRWLYPRGKYSRGSWRPSVRACSTPTCQSSQGFSWAGGCWVSSTQGPARPGMLPARKQKWQARRCMLMSCRSPGSCTTSSFGPQGEILREME